MRTMARFVCERCGKHTQGRADAVQSGRKRFCSVSCANSARATQKHLATPDCGKDNPNWKGGISKNNYHYKQLQKQRYPERIQARQRVSGAIRSGKLVRAKTCEMCGCETMTEAHHADYSKPLDVTWLCRPCHREIECFLPGPLRSILARSST